MALLVPGKFLYLANPRVASRATVRALRLLSRDSEGEIVRRHHCSLEKVKEIADYQGEMVVCTIRNPWDQIVSAYHMFRQENETFKEFLYGDLWLGKPGRICLWPHYLAASRIWRYETLLTDIQETLKEFDIPPLQDFPLYGKSDRLHYCDYYSEEMREYVAKTFAYEIAEGNYDY